MDYDDLAACIGELSAAHSTECHQVFGVWTQKCESGLDELYVDYNELTNILNNRVVFESDVFYNLNGTTFDQPWPGIRSTPIRLTGRGHESECSELYRPGDVPFGFNRIRQDQNRGLMRINYLPVRDEKFYYPPGTTVPGFGDLS
jgi:hypothetical protein